MHLILMGLRGSGKTTLGQRLAAETGLFFSDLDRRTIARFGARSVAEAWSRYGEAAFRQAEVDALHEVIDQDIPLLALGGGTPTAPGAAAILRGLKTIEHPYNPQIVYLRAPPEALAARLRADGAPDRPSLTGADPIDEIAAVFAARDPLYVELADEVLEVGDLDVRAATERLLNIMQWG